MGQTDIDKFTATIISLNAPPIVGNNSSGGLGALGPAQATLLDLKKNTLDLASGLRSGRLNKTDFTRLSDRVEGGLRGLRTFGVIDNRRLAGLLSELGNLGRRTFKN